MQEESKKSLFKNLANSIYSFNVPKKKNQCIPEEVIILNTLNEINLPKSVSKTGVSFEFFNNFFSSIFKSSRNNGNSKILPESYDLTGGEPKLAWPMVTPRPFIQNNFPLSVKALNPSRSNDNSSEELILSKSSSESSFSGNLSIKNITRLSINNHLICPLVDYDFEVENSESTAEALFKLNYNKYKINYKLNARKFSQSVQTDVQSHDNEEE